ncbi:MAG: isoprenylcysteine carboxylmethyltransferase family protein, partial [Candidatus Thorarchaeota archaeon]
FRILFIAIFIVFAVVRIPYRIKSAGSKPETRVRNKKWVELLMSVGILGYFATLVLYLLFIPVPLIPQLILPSWIRWVGIALALITVPYLLWIHRTLGKQYAAELAIQSGHSVISIGPYHRVRHPMYTVFIVFSIALAFTTSDLLVLFFALLLSIPFPWVARQEEQMLIEQFGDEYIQYMERTGRFFPKLRS